MIPAWLTDTVTSDLDRALHYTLLWGLEGVELRTVGTGADRVPFVNEEKLRRRLAEHEMPVVALVPGLFEAPASARAAWLNDLALLEDTLRFATRHGAGRIVVSAFAEEEGEGGAAVEALQRAGETAARHGILLAVLNEVGMAHPTGAALGRLLGAVAHPSVGAAWDPAAAVQAGEDAGAGLEALAGHVALVRCRDGELDGEKWVPALPGEGAVGWEAQLRQLHAHGFNGPISLEIAVEPRPKSGLRAATRLIEMIRAARR